MSISRFIFQTLAKTLSTKGLYIVKSLSYKKKPQSLPANLDYVRYATLGLCYEEITAKEIKGNVAELGVYKGDFAKRLNLLFPEKKLYLFDTFEGFNKLDIKVERDKGFGNAEQDFSQTSIDLVRNKMPFPQNCIFKPGYFPQTAEGLEDVFCFVSLDADLYEPIYQGLQYFYPRLQKGGYIFIHDFNNGEYLGAREAVIKFSKENNVGYTPIPDNGGTVIITK